MGYGPEGCKESDMTAVPSHALMFPKGSLGPEGLVGLGPERRARTQGGFCKRLPAV